MSLDRVVLDRLVCPLTRTRLIYDETAQELVSEAAGLAFPVRDGVPVMLVEAARKVTGGDLPPAGRSLARDDMTTRSRR